jgi:transposase
MATQDLHWVAMHPRIPCADGGFYEVGAVFAGTDVPERALHRLRTSGLIAPVVVGEAGDLAPVVEALKGRLKAQADRMTTLEGRLKVIEGALSKRKRKSSSS